MRKISYAMFLETKSGDFVRTDDVISHWTMEQIGKLLTACSRRSLFTAVGKLATQDAPESFSASTLPALGLLSLEAARKDWPSVVQH